MEKLISSRKIQRGQVVRAVYDIKHDERTDLYDAYISEITPYEISVYSFQSTLITVYTISDYLYFYIDCELEDFYSRYPKTVLRLARNLQRTTFYATRDNYDEYIYPLIAYNFPNIVYNYFKYDGQFEITGVVLHSSVQSMPTGLVIRDNFSGEEVWWDVREDVIENLIADARCFLESKGEKWES